MRSFCLPRTFGITSKSIGVWNCSGFWRTINEQTLRSTPLTKRANKLQITVVHDLELLVVNDFFDQFELVFERWKKPIAFNDLLDQRQVKVRAQRQSLLINLSTAA